MVCFSHLNLLYAGNMPIQALNYKPLPSFEFYYLIWYTIMLCNDDYMAEHKVKSSCSIHDRNMNVVVKLR